METLLGISQPEDMTFDERAEECPGIGAKFLLFLCRDLLPSLLIIFVAGGLSLLLLEIIEQHRPNQPVALVAEK